MYEDKIADLEIEESFDMLLAYADALFEIGEHEKHLEAADRILEGSVMNNIKFFHGEDIFQKTLFQKAASNFNLYEFEKCDYILREMLKIDPYDRDGALFLKKCLRSMRSATIRKSRNISVLLLIGSAMLICLELLIVRSFFPTHPEGIVFLRTLTLALSVTVLLGGELYHRFRCSREVDNFVWHLKRRNK